MPILHACVETFGFVPQEAVRVIANELNLSRAEVHGVVTFYHDFRREPAGKHVLKMCRAEACQSMGCEPLVKQAEDRLGIKCGETSADGRVTLEPIYCLGLCATAPSAMLDGKIVGRLNEAKLDKLLKGAGV
jgi:formate dehydrogenase subunit gamma